MKQSSIVPAQHPSTLLLLARAEHGYIGVALVGWGVAGGVGISVVGGGIVVVGGVGIAVVGGATGIPQ